MTAGPRSDSTVTTSAPRLGAEYADTASTAYQAALQVIGSVEPRIAAATRKELADQRDSLKLIASENYASPAVLLTIGTWLSDKYAEGRIGHRFYAGCQNVDTVEGVAAEHACELFGAPHAYVQCHSGSDANLVAYWAILATRIEAPSLAEAGAKHVNDPRRARQHQTPSYPTISTTDQRQGREILNVKRPQPGSGSALTPGLTNVESWCEMY